MLSQRLPLTAQQSALGNPSAFKKLTEGKASFEKTLTALTEGDDEVPASGGAALETVEKIGAHKGLVSRTADPLRQQCEGYAKRLGVLVAHWLLLVSGWHHETLGALDALRILRTLVPLAHAHFDKTLSLAPPF